jgi:hypothetical protein
MPDQTPFFAGIKGKIRYIKGYIDRGNVIGENRSRVSLGNGGYRTKGSFQKSAL